MPYQAQISRAAPTCIAFMIDQSASMGDPFGSGETRESKADYVATVINRFLRDLVLRCTKGADEPYNYFYVALIGYGARVGPTLSGPLAGRELLPISDVGPHPASTVERVQKQADGAGGLVETTVTFPVWLEATADNGTPMCAAFDRVHSILSQWLDAHPDCFPPIVINLTDGESTDGDPASQADRIRALASSDGQVLVFNCHISSAAGSAMMFPSDPGVLPDQYAQMLFNMSSELPSDMLQEARRQLQRDLPEGTRGFTFQADMVAVTQFITIGTQVSKDLR